MVDLLSEPNVPSGLWKANGVEYLWPPSQVAGGLENDGSGNLSWANRPVIVASTALADPLTLPAGHDIIVPITGVFGNVPITNITAPAINGTRATLVFASANAYVTTTGNIKLINVYESLAGGTLTIYYDGTNWVELARSPTRGTNTQVPSPLTFGGTSSTGTASIPSRLDHGHGMPGDPTTILVTPAVLLGTAAAPGVASSSIHSDATILAFDATAPQTVMAGTPAAAGSAAVSARRDHDHAFPADYRAAFLMLGG